MSVSPKILWVFWIEALANIPAALIILFLPSIFLGGLVEGHAFDAFHLVFARWYGVLLLVLSLALIACLRYGGKAVLRAVLTAFLIGDVLQILVSLQLGMTFGWTAGVWGAIGSSVIYALCRILYLKTKSGL